MSELTSINPENNESIGSLKMTPLSDIASIVERSKSAQKLWADTDISKRATLLIEVHKKVEASMEDMAKLIHQEMGKPFDMALGEVKASCAGIEAKVEEIVKAFAPETYSDGQVETTRFRDPLGVNVCITPWNFPILMAYQLLVPSLLAGNSIIFKPSEETSFIGKAYAEKFMEVLPKDVFQLTIGDGALGAALVDSDVQLISFVGSKATGEKILTSSGQGLKRVLLELGGKDPMIVLKDADLDKAVHFACNNSFRNSGQVCVSTEKIIVHKDIQEEFTKRLSALASDFKIGPMINSKQKKIVLDQVKDALDKGAKLSVGTPLEDKGNYIFPTVMTGVNPKMDIYQRETFGPIACIMEFDDTQEAVDLANDTEYGLGAVVFGSANNEETKNVARKLKAGMIGINKGCHGAKGSAWVGANKSGYGFHSSTEGHRQFTQLRQVSFPKV